jgi:exonuclease VII large subunit
VLARGYAVCWTADRTSIVHSASAVAEGDRVHVTLAEGELECRVEAKMGKDAKMQRSKDLKI